MVIPRYSPLSSIIFMIISSLSTTLLVEVLASGYPATSYYPQVKKYPYLPSPPGDTPNCAKKGATYCEKIETYPTEVISYLLYKWGKTYQQFIQSESDRDFFLISKTYGPVPYEGGYSDDGGSLPENSYLPVYDSNDYKKGPGNGSNDQVESYYRRPHQHPNINRQQRGHNSQPVQPNYGYSFTIPGKNQNGQTRSSSGTDNHNQIVPTVAAASPVLHSVWWNHRNLATNQQTYPHLNQYNDQSWQQRWRRRAKRQASLDNQLCPTVSNFITPQAAMNNEGNWMYVVNMGDTQYIQRVRSELCASGDGSPCDGVCSVPPGFSANCRQKYVQKRLVALDGTGESLRNDVFWFAHCCVCEVNQR